MDYAVFITIALTGFTIAFFHAALPAHWLPFVLASRAQRWNQSKTLCVTASTGGDHVLFTTVLGVLVVWLGIGLNKNFGDAFPHIAGSALVIIGLYYIIRQIRGSRHRHSHFLGGHDHPHDNEHHQYSASSIQLVKVALPSGEQPIPTSDRVAIGSLFALVTFSPCEKYLPVYLSAIKFGWTGFFLLSAILATATLAGMVIFAWLTLLGLKKLKLTFLSITRWEFLVGCFVC